MKLKVIIFGASKLGNIAFNSLTEKYDIKYFSDNDPNKIGNTFHGLEIIEPSSVIELNDFKIIVASEYYNEILKQLISTGILNLYIFSYSIDYLTEKIIPYVTKFENISLEKKDILSKKILKKNTNLPIKKNSQQKTVLFFAILFPPIGGGGVQRSLKFVKYLLDFGWKPIVITVGNSYHNINFDYSLLDEIPQEVEIIRVDSSVSNKYQISKNKLSAIASLIIEMIGDKKLKEKLIAEFTNPILSHEIDILQPDRYISWVYDVLYNIENLVDLKKIDLVYTTGGPFSNHINGYYLRKTYNLPWVADFRDEWTNNPFNNFFYKNKSYELSLHKEIEKSLIYKADNVISVTPKSRKNFINLLDLNKKKVITITNGFDSSDFKGLVNTVRNNKFTITHYGSLYFGRIPINTLSAINKLIESNKIDKNKITLNLYGKIDADIKLKLYALDFHKILKISGYLPHTECISKGFSSDILLLYIGESKKLKPIYSGKLFEYLKLNKPILSLSPNSSEVEILLNNHKAGSNYHPNDTNGIKYFIYKKYIEWEENGFVISNSINIKKFERKNLTQSLSKIFNKLISDYKKHDG